jgi:hypothetical protein
MVEEYPSKSSNWSSQTRAHMAETGYNQCGFLCRLDLWDASASARAVSLCVLIELQLILSSRPLSVLRPKPSVQTSPDPLQVNGLCSAASRQRLFVRSSQWGTWCKFTRRQDSSLAFTCFDGFFDEWERFDKEKASFCSTAWSAHRSLEDG